MTRWEAAGAAVGAASIALLDELIQAVPEIVAGAGVGVVKRIADGEFGVASLLAGAAVGAAGGFLARRFRMSRQKKDDWPRDYLDGGER